MKYDLFISYSSKDQKVVEALSHYLEDNKIRCFVAYRDIPKGKVWAAVITEAIEESQMMLVLFSEHFNQSDQVDREIEMCCEEKKPILTYRISDTAFKGAKKYYLKNLNWIDAFPDPEANFGELLNSILKLIDISPAISKAQEERARREAAKEESDDPLNPTDAEAQYNLGCNYYNGNRVAHNYNEVVKWYRKAAEQGHAKAQYNIGLFYSIGFGGVISQDYNEAVKWYRKAAEQGDAEAQYDLGECYYYGKGVDEDEEEAVKWYRKAAAQGKAAAQYSLAACYYNGEGVDEDVEEAVKWYRKAAEQGNEDAQYCLATCYYNGEGVDEDEEEAVKWYRKAAEQGNADAQDNLRKITANRV